MKTNAAPHQSLASAPIARSDGDRATDLLSTAKLNALPHPIVARIFGGEWEVETIDVETGLIRIFVCGLLECRHFSEVQELVDINGGVHDSDEFYNEEETAG